MTASSHTGEGVLEQIALYEGKGNFPMRFQPKKKNWDTYVTTANFKAISSRIGID